MKLRDWLKQVVTPLVEKPEDAELFVSASNLNDVEVSDEMAKAFGEKYLTRDRAKTDPDIIADLQRDAKGLVFGSVDQKLKTVFSVLPADVQTEIEAEKNTLKRLEILARELPSIGKGSSEDVKKIQEAARKKEEELHRKNEEFQLMIENSKKEFDGKLKDYKLEYNLKTKLAGFDLAPEFSDENRKNFLAESTISKLKQNFVLEFDEQNPSTIHLRKNIDGLVKDVYEGNNKITLDDVLKKEYEPFLKKSNSKEEGHKPPTPTKFEVKTDQPMDLKTMRQAAASS